MSASKKKNYLKGATILAFGGIMAKFLGMFLKIPLNRTIGELGMGLYANAYPVYTFLLAISTIGLPVAISKMVSERLKLGQYDAAYKVFRVAITTLAIIGGICTCIMFFGAKFFINLFNWHPDTFYSIMGLALAPLFVCLLSSFKGFFQGMQNMTPPSVSQIVESFTRVIVGLGLAMYLFKKLGVAYGAAGATFGATAGAMVASLFMFICFLRVRPKLIGNIKEQAASHEEDIKTILKILAAIAIPITLASLVTSSMNLINSFTVSHFLQKIGYSVDEATVLWGILSQKAQVIISIPIVLASALAASLVPTISESHVVGDTEQIVNKTYVAMKVLFLITLPCIVGLVVLPGEILTLLFGNDNGTNMLRVLSLGLLFTMVSTSMQGILQGIGKVNIPVRNLGIGCIIKLILNIILIQVPFLNIYGAILGTLGADLVVSSLDFGAVRKYTGGKYGGLIKSFFMTLACSALMGLVCYVVKRILIGSLGVSITTVVAIFVAMLVYCPLVYFTGVLDINEVKSVAGR